jgi:hypothetical protein
MILEVGGGGTGNDPRPNVIATVVGSLSPLLTALVEISFSSVGKAMAYNVRGPGIKSQSGTLHCSGVKHALMLHNFEST